MNDLSFPKITASLHEQGKAFQAAGNYEPAIAAYSKHLQTAPANVDAAMRLAACLYAIKKPEQSLAAWRKALRLAPNHPEIIAGIGDCYKDLGEFDKAIAHYEKLFKMEPTRATLLYNLTLLKDYPLNTTIHRALQALYAVLPAQDAARIFVCFALGRLYESNGKIREGFAYFTEGNKLQFALCNYNEKGWFDYFDALERVFTPELFARLQPACSMDATPIFIVGMPRSGTSLVEQILASHSLVYGAGEADIMPRLAEENVAKLAGIPYPPAMAHMQAQDLAQVATVFLERLRAVCPGGSPRITNKTLQNFAHIGLIHILLPKAPIIHCMRDPMDNGWSILRQHFAGNLPYCYDQQVLGRFYRRYEQLMRHWRRVLPQRLYEVRYEELAQNPESAIPALLDACGLPFEKGCLAFYRTKRAVITASLRQVRRPMYTSSIQSWQPVADLLAPLQAALGL